MENQRTPKQILADDLRGTVRREAKGSAHIADFVKKRFGWCEHTFYTKSRDIDRMSVAEAKMIFDYLGYTEEQRVQFFT